MDKSTIMITSFCTGVWVCVLFMVEVATVRSFDECNVIKPSGTICVLELTYNFKEK